MTLPARPSATALTPTLGTAKASSRPPEAATGVASVSPGIQPSASSGSPGNANTGRCVSAVSQELSVAGAGTRIPSDHVGAQRARAGYVSLEKARPVLDGSVMGREPRAIAGGPSLVHNLVRTTSLGTLRQPKTLCHAPAENAEPSHRRCRGRGLAPFPGSSSTLPGGLQCVSHPPGLKCQLSARPHSYQTPPSQNEASSPSSPELTTDNCKLLTPARAIHPTRNFHLVKRGVKTIKLMFVCLGGFA